MPRKTYGRKKLEMKKIPGESALQVTFSKRKTGIFNKASEISIMCGVDLLVVIFSPGGRPYIFGSPEANSIIESFATGNPMESIDPYTCWGLSIRHLASEFRTVSLICEKEKKYLCDLKKTMKECGVVDDEDLGVDELEVYLNSLKKMKKELLFYSEYLKENRPATSGLCPFLTSLSSGSFHGNDQVGSNFIFP